MLPPGAEKIQIVTEDAERDARIRYDAARFIGACLTGDQAELALVQEAAAATEQIRPIESLYDAIQLAAEGDTQAREMIRINVATDVVERTMKSAHITKVRLNVDEAGRIQQYRHSMESIQANSLRLASDSRQMLARTKAETTNSFRIADYHQRGDLEHYNIVVFSRAADDMPEDDMRRVGFFTDTMSTSIQVTSGDGQTITTESAFVAGKRDLDSDRHDAQTLGRVGRQLGVELAGLSATELLAAPLRIPKSLMPNGVIDLVQLYDQAAGGTWFGEAKAGQDYLDYLEVCRDREARFSPLVESIVNKLIAEAPFIQSRLAATRRLHELSQDQMVIQAAVDEDINPQVFGAAAAVDIVAARSYINAGDIHRGLLLAQQAQRVAVSSSCPFGQANEEAEANQKLADCEFVSKECPKCGEKNVHTKVSNGKITGSCGCSDTLK